MLEALVRLMLCCCRAPDTKECVSNTIDTSNLFLTGLRHLLRHSRPPHLRTRSPPTQLSCPNAALAAMGAMPTLHRHLSYPAMQTSP